VDNYLTFGGDGFTAPKGGTAPQFGVYDVDALFAYLQANSPLAPGLPDRIVRID
jgi:5'-nucleotidase